MKPAIQLLTLLFLFSLLFTGIVSAETITLSSETQDLYTNGLIYTGTDELILILKDDVVISNVTGNGIESYAPLTIKGNGTLTVTGGENAITAPSITILSGTINAFAGKDDCPVSCAINANAGNLLILGGTVNALAESTSHKNKGIYAESTVIILDGYITTTAKGTVNCFAIDGYASNKTGGVIISGGTVIASALEGQSRNIGIDSKYGTVTFAGNPVVIIYADNTGSENFALNPKILTLTGENAVIFAGCGSNCVLLQTAKLTRDLTLPHGNTFEIPAGLTLSVAKDVIFNAENAELIYTDNALNVESPMPILGIFVGLGLTSFLICRRERR